LVPREGLMMPSCNKFKRAKRADLATQSHARLKPQSASRCRVFSWFSRSFLLFSHGFLGLKTTRKQRENERKQRENEGKTEDRRKTRENPRKREEKKTTAPPNDLFSAVCHALSITHGLFEYSPGRLRGTLRFEFDVAVAVAGF
jgi:hypothetical protein